MTKSLTEYLLSPVSPKQNVLDDLNRVENLLDEITIYTFGELDKPKLIDAVHSNNTEYLNSFQKKLCAESVRDIKLAKGLVNNWDDLLGAYKLIARINFNRGVLLEEYSQTKQISEKMSINASKGHANNKAIKEDAIQYYRDNRQSFTSKDNAAEKIALQFNRSFATVRVWLRGI